MMMMMMIDQKSQAWVVGTIFAFRVVGVCVACMEMTRCFQVFDFFFHFCFLCRRDKSLDEPTFHSIVVLVLFHLAAVISQITSAHCAQTEASASQTNHGGKWKRRTRYYASLGNRAFAYSRTAKQNVSRFLYVAIISTDARPSFPFALAFHGILNEPLGNVQNNSTCARLKWCVLDARAYAPRNRRVNARASIQDFLFHLNAFRFGFSCWISIWFQFFCGMCVRRPSMYFNTLQIVDRKIWNVYLLHRIQMESDWICILLIEVFSLVRAPARPQIKYHLNGYFWVD